MAVGDVDPAIQATRQVGQSAREGARKAGGVLDKLMGGLGSKSARKSGSKARASKASKAKARKGSKSKKGGRSGGGG